MKVWNKVECLEKQNTSSKFSDTAQCKMWTWKGVNGDGENYIKTNFTIYTLLTLLLDLRNKLIAQLEKTDDKKNTWWLLEVRERM
jgi:hypothetical protein